MDVRKMLGFEADGQERILEMSLVQNGDFIRAQGQDPAAALGCEGWLIKYLGGGGGKEKGDFKRIFTY